MILLDTNVISETRKPRGSARVKQHVNERAGDLYLSAVVLGELRFGISRLREPDRKIELEGWYATLTATYLDVILPVTLAIAERWGDVSARLQNQGRIIDAPDGLIAATALVHDLVLWTGNTRDFEGLGVELFDPWEA